MYSVLYLTVPVLQKPSRVLLSLHYGSCPLPDWWLWAKIMKRHQKSPAHQPKTKLWWLICNVPGIPRISLFINSYYENVENIQTLLDNDFSRPKDVSEPWLYLSRHFAWVIPDIFSLWKWSRRLHKLSLSFYCHHPSCNSQEETSKWMPLYSF